MKKWPDILGMNARNHHYLRYNTKKGRQIADSKLATKKILTRHNLPTPELIKTFINHSNIDDFSWLSLPDNFVLKPSGGFGGGGILVIRKKSRFAGEWELMNGEIVSIPDLKFHVQEILSGRYSLHNTPDKAFIEERVRIIKVFSKYVKGGTPDIRVIVFNMVPVMAMLRLPTEESDGKANLHQGAVGVGIDLATGVTTYGIYHNRPIRYLPGTKIKVNGLKVPNWEQILLHSVRTQETISSLGYLGIDFLIDKNKGPLIVELNARPGLSIQVANKTGLKKRLERVERLEVRSFEHGVKIAKALFGASFSDRVDSKNEPKIVNLTEEVKIVAQDKTRVSVATKVDTGADRSAIDEDLA
ncbi:MAG: sugar-transfer associated ATP-grasp domain-containing protein, partial [Candidatus Shapirobacteria bacterium]|nr:sugar-transfer associated ATP-grasp domain-containing protein [Candidatus Shapirobacteria bacterium]